MNKPAPSEISHKQGPGVFYLFIAYARDRGTGPYSQKEYRYAEPRICKEAAQKRACSVYPDKKSDGERRNGPHPRHDAQEYAEPKTYGYFLRRIVYPE